MKQQEQAWQPRSYGAGLILGVKYARLLPGRPFLATCGLLLALLTGCDRPEDVKPPAQLLTKEKMVSMLVQLHLLEARVEASRLSIDSARALYQSQQSLLLRKNNVPETDSVLQRSYRFYAINRKDMEEIYAAVIDSLQKREAKMDKQSRPAVPVHP
jgi:hypothetical protein